MRHHNYNKNWKKRWKNVVKNDQDWDFDFFLKIVVHKLELMYDYYKNCEDCVIDDESRNSISEEIGHAIELGKRVIADDFYYSVHEKFSEYCKVVKHEDNCVEFVFDSPEKESEYRDEVKKADKERENVTKEFFNYIGKNLRKWWD